MTQHIYVDRSRHEQYGRCPRSRYLEYHAGPEHMGIVSARKPLPLAVGSSVHAGLAALLCAARDGREQDAVSLAAEEEAVKVALRDFAEYQSALELPDAEAVALATPEITADNPISEEMNARRNEVDEYLFREQSALVEAMVRAYARRRLRPLLEQFEVLEVEREGEWLLADWRTYKQNSFGEEYEDVDRELWFMSRPDALLRERESNSLYLLSYKTAASWDVRKAKDAEHDMQGMSEGIEIERRLGQWWDVIQRAKETKTPVSMGREADCSPAMQRYLFALDAPPRILAVRMEYMLKGERWKDKDLSQQFGVEMRSQKSHLIRQYVAVSTPARGIAGYNIGDVNCSWDFVREDGRDGSLAWQNFKSRPVWDQPGGVKAWIDKLDDAAPTMSAEDSTMGLEPRQLGYKCDAQVSGYLKEHPLDSVFIPPIIVYRNEDELRDMVDQMEAQERRIAEGVAAVQHASDEGDRHHELNVHFPQTRRACSYPTECAYTKICYGGEDIRRDPLGSGLYTIRKVNHPQENPTT
jgi:hypothetical protein